MPRSRTLSPHRLQAVATNRRQFLTLTGAAAATALSPWLLGITSSRDRPTAAGRMPDDPFKIGIASGDPLPTAVIIWTRLVVDPFAPFGGMDYVRVPVQWQVAQDERFRRIVKSGSVMARPESAHAVKVDVQGLEPGREYFYRFRAGSEISPIGRTKTAPPPDTAPNQQSFAFASCQSWTSGYYTAYADMAERDFDFIVHLGDYIYEYGFRPDVARNEELPLHLTFPDLPDTITLDQYRDHYAVFKADPDLQAAHAAAPWIVMIDDHEVMDNWAGEFPRRSPPSWYDGEPLGSFLTRRANAFRAHWENMPVRTPLPDSPDMQLYRRFGFGDLIDLNMLDTRQYRSRQVNQDSPAWQDPARTVTGDKQEAWLLDGIADSNHRWSVLAQQNAMAQLDSQEGDGQTFGMDRWDGYPASRDRILQGAHERGARNLISIGGDVHRSIASDLKLDFNDPDSETIGAEFVGTSISSGGNGVDLDAAGHRTLNENPHVKYVNVQRGYVDCTVTPDEWRSDYRVAEYITERGGPMYIRTSLVVEDGRPGIQSA